MRFHVVAINVIINIIGPQEVSAVQAVTIGTVQATTVIGSQFTNLNVSHSVSVRGETDALCRQHSQGNRQTRLLPDHNA